MLKALVCEHPLSASLSRLSRGVQSVSKFRHAALPGNEGAAACNSPVTRAGLAKATRAQLREGFCLGHARPSWAVHRFNVRRTDNLISAFASIEAASRLVLREADKVKITCPQNMQSKLPGT